jgi:hypothetical protein
LAELLLPPRDVRGQLGQTDEPVLRGIVREARDLDVLHVGRTLALAKNGLPDTVVKLWNGAG